MVYILVIGGFVFNWVVILSFALKRVLERAKKLDVEMFPKFYMVS